MMKAHNVQCGGSVAIKCMKNMFSSIQQVNSLREIQALRRLNPHENIIELEDVLYDKTSGRLALVFELMDMNIYEMIRNRKRYVEKEDVRDLMWQLMKAVNHMHQNGIFHRDIKPENVLVTEKVLKVADFGSCRGMYTKQPFTEYISTRWYRAPECLLTNGYYGAEMDVWGVGCVLFEIVALFPLFPGTNELDQIEKVHKVLGTPDQSVLNVFRKKGYGVNINFPEKEGTGLDALIPDHVDEDCVDLIKQLVTYNPDLRPTSEQVLEHRYFDKCREKEEREQAMKEAVPIMSPTTNASAIRKERRRKEPSKDKLPTIAKRKRHDKVKGSKSKNFNATMKDFSVAGNKHHGTKAGGMFKPSATINLGAPVPIKSDDDNGDILSPAEEGPFSDTDAVDKDFKSLSIGDGDATKSNTKRRTKLYRKKRNMREKKDKQEYYHIGNGGGGGGKSFMGRIMSNTYNMKKEKQKKQPSGLPSLSKNPIKQPKVHGGLKGEAKVQMGLAYSNKSDELDQLEAPGGGGGGLQELIMTTQYKFKSNNGKDKKSKEPMVHGAGDHKNFSIHKSFAGPDQKAEGTMLSEIVNVRKVNPSANDKS